MNVLKALKDRLAALLEAPAAVPPEALPLERLASSLGRLPQDPALLAEVTGLLGDGLTGGLLYRCHADLVLGALARALPSLDEVGRLALVTASLELRPITNDTLVRMVGWSLDAFGMTGADATAATIARWSLATQRMVYRWSSAMLQATALQTGELAALLAARGIVGQGGHPWDLWQDVVGYRGTVLMTPRMSPAVAHELTSMQRTEWLDQPWMFGAADSTFTLDEIEEDSTPQNMDDGRRIAYSLMRQRSPSTDFFGKSYAWHPRQTLEHVRAVTVEHGFDIVEPLAFDKSPRSLERHELDAPARALQARAVRAMARLEGQWPVDVTLRFCDGGDEGPLPLFELSMAASLKNDGTKWTVRVVSHDAEAVLSTLASHSKHMSTVSAPLLLSALAPAARRIEVEMPEGPYVLVGPAQLGAWRGDAAAVVPAPRARALPPPPPSSLLGVWRGHSTPDHYDEPQPLALELSHDGAWLRALATTSDFGPMELKGAFADGRVALRQDVPHRGYVLEAAWDEVTRTLTGRWAYGGSGGGVSLSIAPAPRHATAAELIAEVTQPWSSHVSIDLEALRFPGERAMLQALFDDEHFRVAYLESAAQRALGTEQMHLDAMLGRGATRLSRAMVPSAFRALDQVKAGLGLSDDVSLWVHNNATLNAFVTVDDSAKKGARAIAIHLTSGLLDVLDEVELQATLGHELGHVVFGAHDLALRLANTRMSGLVRDRYFALRRLQELSADRLSLLACADAKAVFVAQALLRTGITKRSLFGDVDAVVDNARAEVDHLLTTQAAKAQRSLLDTHPYTSLRTVALSLFARSQLFRSLRPQVSVRDPISDTQLAASLEKMAALLAVPDPQALPVDADATDRFVALATLWLLEADNGISVRELASLKGRPRVAPHLDDVLSWTHERRDTALVELRRAVMQALPLPAREQLVAELLLLVRADGVVHYAEASAVDEIGRLLELETPTFRRQMEELYRSAR